MLRSAFLLLGAFALLPGVPAAQTGEVNVALAKWGATARASSAYGATYQAGNALDGRWASRETDKWNSASHAAPHWLLVDLGQERIVHRVVIRHEGVFGEGEAYNTRDFRLQRGEGPDGRWTDLIPPVTGNTASVTTHRFAPTPARWLRLLITRGERSGNEFARIFEIEVYATVSALKTPLLAVSLPPRYRRQGDRLEQQAVVEAALPPGHGAWSFRLQVGDRPPVSPGPPDAQGARTAWIPAARQAATARVVVTAVSTQGDAARVERECALRPPEAVLGGAAFPAAFQGGTVHIVSSSHQDIAWMDTPERCIEQRDRQVITPALEIMKRDPGFRFVMEDTLALREYLERHPERREEIRQRTREGRFEWATTYNQPYESLESGESLVRQLYLGRRWLKRALPGCDTRVAWSPDVPGRAMQMPQILHKAGVKYLVMSRHAAGFYRWLSPDGTGVLAYSPGHYGDAWDRLRGDTPQVAGRVAADLTQWESYYRQHDLPPAFGYIVSVDASGPQDFGALRGNWPQIEGAPSPENPAPPRLLSSTSEAFLDAVAQGNPDLPTITGERPNVWLYIHGPAHQQAIAAKREAARLLPAAELFSTALALATGSFKTYPAQALDRAWQAAIYPDHGWGGYYGEITDALFAQKLAFARDTGRRLLARATASLAAKVRPARDGMPLVVFNALSWQRADPVECEVRFRPGEARGFRLLDGQGREVACQVLARARYRDGSLRSARIVFIAANVPSMGYATWYLRPAAALPHSLPRPSATTYENAFYRIRLAPGGIGSLYDRQLRREALRSEKFLGGELFTMQSVGNGAGEFATVQQPTMEEFDRLARHAPAWRCVESGPVRTVFELSLPQSAHRLRHVSVRQRLIAYREIKRLDFETDLIGWDGTPWREFRLAFPVNLPQGRIAYEAPMGVVKVGKSEIAGAAGERYTQPCKDVRPREVQNWMDCSDGTFGVTLSSSVAVFDFADPTAGPVAYPMLQPILLASRKSCHGLGNYYLQPGNHSFRFSLLSHPGGWENGRRFGCQANSPLLAVFRPARSGNPALPDRLSFCRVSPENVVVSAVKKAEEEDRVVVRCYDTLGRDAQARIRLFVPAQRAEQTNLIEEEGRPLPVRGGAAVMPVGHHAIETLKLTPRVPRASLKAGD